MDNKTILINDLLFNKMFINLLTILNFCCNTISILLPKTNNIKLDTTSKINIIVYIIPLILNFINSFVSSTSYAELSPLHKAKNPFPADHKVTNAEIVIVPTDFEYTSFTILITASFKILLGICKGKKNFDKRETIKDRDIKREVAKNLKNYK